MKILLIDDDQELISLLEMELKEHGHEVETAQDGITGCSLALKNSFDVIVLDLMLPGVDGHTICKRIRFNHNNTPLLMISALDSEEEKVTAFSAGANDYMVKPFSYEDLHRKIISLDKKSNQKV